MLTQSQLTSLIAAINAELTNTTDEQDRAEWLVLLALVQIAYPN